MFTLIHHAKGVGMLTSARSTALPCETVRKSTAMSASWIPAACCSRMHCTTAASSSLSVLHSTICAQHRTASEGAARSMTQQGGR